MNKKNKQNESNKKWRKNNPKKFKQIMRAGHYRRRYNCTIADYGFLFIIQNGKCACCGREDNYEKDFFDIDHDHYTGKMRGLLCKYCNRMVGIAEHCCDFPVPGFPKKMKKMAEKYLTGRVLLDII